MFAAGRAHGAAFFTPSHAKPVSTLAPATTGSAGLRETAEPWLLDKVLRAPELDEPRRNYADFMDMIGDPRGEFIRLQIAAVHDDPASPEARRRMLAADRLLKQHGTAWAGAITGLVESYVFSRGFVELVVMGARDFLASAARLKELAPVMHLEVSDAVGVWGERLLRSELLEPLRSLSLDGCGLTDRHAELIAENGALINLRWLSLANNEIGKYGVHVLASSPNLRSVRFVNLIGNPYDPTPRFAHEDSRVVDVWQRTDDHQLPQTSRTEPWMRTDSLPSPFVPDRFRLALAQPAGTGAARVGAAAVA